MKALPRPVQSYISAAVLGAAGLATWYLFGHGLPSTDQLPLAGLLVACVTLAWLYPMPIGFKTHLYLDTAVLIAAVLLFEPGVAMVIVGAGTLAGQLIRHRYRDEAFFNAAQTMLQAALAAALLTVSGFHPGIVQADDPGFVVATLAMGITLFVASAVLVGTIVSLQGGLNPIGVWIESILKADDTVYLGHIAQIGLGIAVAVLGDAHPWTIILLIPPVAVVYLALDHGMELRRQISLALRLQEKNLTEAQRMARIGSWEWDLSSGAQGWSEEAFRILGYEPPFPIPTLDHLLDRVHPDDRELLDGRIHAAVRYQSWFDLEHRILRPDGTERMVHHRGEVSGTDENGEWRIVAIIHDISEQKSLEMELEHLAFHDPLTGLLNRSRLSQEIDNTLEQWRRGGRSFALLFVDLDGFKGVNDSLGHKAGDEILTEIGQRLDQTLRQNDVVARYGGDEFIILARSVTKVAEAEKLAERLLDSLTDPIAFDSRKSISVTASIGVVMPESRLQSSDELLNHVDSALYHAKRHGKNQYAVYDEALSRERPVPLPGSPADT